MTTDTVKQKVEQLAAVLKAEGLWKKAEPQWVKEYKGSTEIPEVDFFEWLQFVYLPNRMLNQQSPVYAGHESYITLQVKKYAGEKIMNEKIVQLLVELDSL